MGEKMNWELYCWIPRRAIWLHVMSTDAADADEAIATFAVMGNAYNVIRDRKWAVLPT